MKLWPNFLGSDSVFKKISTATPVDNIDISIDDQIVSVASDITVASAVMMAMNNPNYRVHLNNEPRAPYCMMGVCHECLVEIDGQKNQQGCLVFVSPGMVIKRQGAHHE
jgi:predicted molibdopterin-dependent oxidoreductase YjgC